MKINRWFIGLVVLVLVSISCQTVLGGSSSVGVPTSSSSNGSNPTLPGAPTNNSGGSSSGSTISSAGFPMPPDALQVTDQGQDLLTYQTNLSLTDTMNFYRDALEKQGLTERKELTVTSDATFSMVFDGHSSGKSVVVQGVTFNGSTTVSVRLEKV